MKFSLQGFWAVGKETFTNGDLSIVTVPTQVGADAYDITGWTIYNRQIFLNGQSTIDGWPTPADATRPASNFSSDLNTASGSYASSYGFSGDIPAGLPAGTRSMQLTSEGNTINNAFGIIRGPYMVSNDALNLESGNTVEFWWRAAGTGDAYDVYGYLLNVANGDTVELLNDTGTSTGSGTAWKKESIVLPSGKSGTYKFVFVSGSYDLSGGRYVGASLFITGSVLQRTIYPPSVEVTVNPMLQAEGDAVTATITTANIGSNIYHWTVIPSSGDVTADDFESGALSGSVVIDVDSQQKGTASINVAARKDRKNEGIETFNIQIEVGDFNRHVIYNSATAITITEPPPGFTIDTAGVTNVDEGSSITAYVSTFENYAIGTYYVTLLPVTGNVDLLDLNSQNLTVELQPDQFGNATAPVSVTISSDFKTEGTETFKLQLRQNSAAGAVLATTQEIITINDTSRGFEVNVRSFYGTQTVSEGGQGGTILIDITLPENLPYGKYYGMLRNVDTQQLFSWSYWALQMSTNYFEFVVGIDLLPGSTFTTSVPTVTDYITEGDEKLKFEIRPQLFLLGVPDTTKLLFESNQIITIKDTTPDKSLILVDQPSGTSTFDYSTQPADVIFIKFLYSDSNISQARLSTGYRIISPVQPLYLTDTGQNQYKEYYGAQISYLRDTAGFVNQARSRLIISERVNAPSSPGLKEDIYCFDVAYFRTLIDLEPTNQYVAVDFFAAWVAGSINAIPTQGGIVATAEFYRSNDNNELRPILTNFGLEFTSSTPPTPFDSKSLASITTLPVVGDNRDSNGYRHVVRFVYNTLTNKGYFDTNI